MIQEIECVRVHLAIIGCNGQEISQAHLVAIECKLSTGCNSMAQQSKSVPNTLSLESSRIAAQLRSIHAWQIPLSSPCTLIQHSAKIFHTIVYSGDSITTGPYSRPQSSLTRSPLLPRYCFIVLWPSSQETILTPIQKLSTNLPRYVSLKIAQVFIVTQCEDLETYCHACIIKYLVPGCTPRRALEVASIPLSSTCQAKIPTQLVRQHMFELIAEVKVHI